MRDVQVADDEDEDHGRCLQRRAETRSASLSGNDIRIRQSITCAGIEGLRPAFGRAGDETSLARKHKTPSTALLTTTSDLQLDKPWRTVCQRNAPR